MDYKITTDGKGRRIVGLYHERLKAPPQKQSPPNPRKAAARRRRGLRKALRASEEMQEWRTAVLSRARGRCSSCLKKRRLQADHIVPLAVIVKEHVATGASLDGATDPANGRALCKRCHYAKTLLDAEQYGWDRNWVREKFGYGAL